MAYTVSNINYDYALADLPFLSAASREHPVERALAEVRKQQFDNSAEPGDQSLSQWWLRSATDWSAGAGQEYMEPVSDERVPRMFHESHGVEVFRTPGQVSLEFAPATYGTTLSSSATPVFTKVSETYGYVAGSAFNQVYRVVAGSNLACTGFGSYGVRSIAGGGGKVFAFDSSGDIYSTTIGNNAFSALWTTTATSSTGGVWWAKQRLMVAKDEDLFELDAVGGDLDAATPLYTHPESGWLWTAVFEGPNAIYAAGYGGTGSAIYRFTLDNTGALPTLSGGAITTAELPNGEYIRTAASYLGAYVLIATNVGLRLGTIQASGEITYGPIFYDEDTTTGTFDMHGRFAVICGGYLSSGGYQVVKIDLSEVSEDGRPAWSYVMGSATYIPYDVIFLNTSQEIIVAGVSGSNTYLYKRSTSAMQSGWFTTGQIRYGTLETKHFASVRYTGSLGPGMSVDISRVDADGTVTSIATDCQPDTDYPIGVNDVSIGLKFSLNHDSGTNYTLNITGWQLRALPAVTRQRLLRYPLLCFDFEKDKSGVEHGYEGQALSRLQALETAVEDGTPVTWQDLNTGETLSVVVESLSFSQTAPPANASGFGGVAEVVMRTV